MFEEDFSIAKIAYVLENIFEHEEWAILGWRALLGLKSCVFYK